MMLSSRFEEDDHFGFMCLSYLFKQRDHLKTILILETRKDVILISRSMLEGLCQLLWAAANKENLAFRWRVYCYIHDWRLLKQKRANGEPVSDEQVAKIEKTVKEYGPMFYSKFTKRTIEGGGKLPNDPYDYNWTGESVTTLFEKVKGKILHKELYSLFSAWHHWNVAGFGEVIVRSEKGLTYQSFSPTDAATSLAAGFQCLFQTADLVNEHHHLGLDEELEKIKKEFVSCFS
jgi:hypothetical protein